MLKALYQLVEWAGQTTPALRAAILLGTSLAAFTTWLNTMWADLFARVDMYTAPLMEGVADFSPLALANYMIPLDTALNLTVLYAGVRLTTVAIRIVKSFVPTIS